MKVILISTKGEFDNEHYEKLQKSAPVKWIKSDQTDLSKINELFDMDEKILAFSPVPMDWKIPNEVIKKLKNVKYICLSTTAYEFLDMKAVAQKDIAVTNVVKYSGNSVAEGALFMMLGLFRKYKYQLDSKFKEIYEKENLMDEIRGRSVGIIGLGDIGNKIADLCKGIGMDVFYHSQNKKDSRYKYLELDKLLASVDVVIPAYTVNDVTSKLLNKESLSLIPNTSYFVDFIGKAGYDSEYILERVSKGQLAGYSFEGTNEKFDEIKGNVFVTAPTNWYTKQSLERDIDIWTDSIISCINGMPINIVK